MSTSEVLTNNIRQLLEQGRTGEAAEACRKALGDHRESAELRMLMGLCADQAGQPDHARAWMEQALEKRGEHQEARFHLGRLLLLEGRDDEARQALETCVAADPNHAPARTLLARIDQRAGKREAAIEGLRTALVADRDFAPAHLGLATMLLRRAELDSAAQHAAMAFRLRPDDMVALVTLAQIQQAQGQVDQAEQILRQVLERQPEQPQVQGALAQLERLKAAGEQPQQQLQRMREHYRQGRLLPAAELADLLQFRFAANDPVLLELAEVLMDGKQIEAATELLERVDAGMPRHGLALARLSAVRGDLAAAQQQLEALMNADSAELRHDARRMSADLHLREQRLEPALAVLAPLGDEPDVLPSTIRLLAQLEHSTGAGERACQRLQKLLDRDGLDADEQAVVHNLLGQFLDESGDIQSADQHLAQGAWREPFIVDELARRSPDSLYQAWAEMSDWPYPDTPVDDGRSAPWFIGGWPGSGREALMALLMAVQNPTMLPAQEIARRRDILRLPATPDTLSRVTEADLRLGRKRYLRGASPGRAGLFEPDRIEVTALPAVARFFPGAKVLWPRASAGAVKLYWRLAGCRDIERMLEAWQREQALFDRLAAIVPLDVLSLDLDELRAGEDSAIADVTRLLGLNDPKAVAKGLDNAFKQAGYRPAGHWRGYE